MRKQRNLMASSKTSKVICPRCTGNGYIRIPNESVGKPNEITAQCTMCESEGEIDVKDDALYFDTNGLHKLQ